MSSPQGKSRRPEDIETIDKKASHLVLENFDQKIKQNSFIETGIEVGKNIGETVKNASKAVVEFSKKHPVATGVGLVLTAYILKDLFGGDEKEKGKESGFWSWTKKILGLGAFTSGAALLGIYATKGIAGVIEKVKEMKAEDVENALSFLPINEKQKEMIKQAIKGKETVAAKVEQFAVWKERIEKEYNTKIANIPYFNGYAPKFDEILKWSGLIGGTAASAYVGLKLADVLTKVVSGGGVVRVFTHTLGGIATAPLRAVSFVGRKAFGNPLLAITGVIAAVGGVFALTETETERKFKEFIAGGEGQKVYEETLAKIKAVLAEQAEKMKKWAEEYQGKLKKALANLGFNDRGQIALAVSAGALGLSLYSSKKVNFVGKVIKNAIPTTIFLAVLAGAYECLADETYLKTNLANSGDKEDFLKNVLKSVKETGVDIKEYGEDLLEILKHPEEFTKQIKEDNDGLALSGSVGLINFLGMTFGDATEDMIEMVQSLGVNSHTKKLLKKWEKEGYPKDKLVAIGEFAGTIIRDGGEVASTNGIIYFSAKTAGLVAVQASENVLRTAWSVISLGNPVETWSDSGGGFFLIAGTGVGLTKGLLLKRGGNRIASAAIGGLRGATLPWRGAKTIARLPLDLEHIVVNQKQWRELKRKNLHYRALRLQNQARLINPFRRRDRNIMQKMITIAQENKLFWEFYGNDSKVSYYSDLVIKLEKKLNTATVMGGFGYDKKDAGKVIEEAKRAAQDNFEKTNLQKGKMGKAIDNSKEAIRGKIKKGKEKIFGASVEACERSAKTLDENAQAMQDAFRRGNKEEIKRLQKAYDAAEQGLQNETKDLPKNWLDKLKLGRLSRLKFEGRGGGVILLTISSVRLIKALESGEKPDNTEAIKELAKDVCPVLGSMRDTSRAYKNFKKGEIKEGLFDSGFAALGWTSDALLGLSAVTFGLSGAAGLGLRGLVAGAKGARAARALNKMKKLGDTAKAQKIGVKAGIASLSLSSASLLNGLWEVCTKTKTVVK